MKWKKWFKKTVIALLAVLLTIPVLSDYSVVKAGEDDYPDEILFPIDILDFRADNLLFEWDPEKGYGLDLYSEDLRRLLDPDGNLGYKRGQGLVETELDPETGLPVYKKEVVIYLAERVQDALELHNGDVLDRDINNNYLSLKRYLEKYSKWYFPDDASQVYGVMAGGAVRPNNANRVNSIGVAGGNDNTPGTVTFRFYSNETKEGCNLNISYATVDVRDFRILVNGEESIVQCPANGSWTVPGNNPVSVEINVQEGWNEIQFGGNNAAAPNLCGFSVEDAERESICDVKIDESVEWREQFDPYPVYARVTNGAVAEPDTGLVHEIYADTNGTFSVWFFSEAESDNIAIYYASADGRRAFNVSVNGGAPVSTGGLNNETWNVNNKAPYILGNVNIKSGWNEIRFEGAGGRAPNLQGFAVNNAEFMVSDLIESAVWLNREYPLGDYDFSKKKFDKHPELGWTDITTCMDYAYFVTSNLFRYNASLNTENDLYKNLVFHKVEDPDTGKVAYEFAADNAHNNMALVYNQVEGTIRNIEDIETETFQMEDGTLRNGAVNNNPCVGNIGGAANGAVDIQYNAAEEGWYTLRVYYATMGARNLKVSVNTTGEEYDINCPNTGSWDNPGGPVMLDVYLREGQNTITFSGVNNGNAPNLDRFEIGTRDRKNGDVIKNGGSLFLCDDITSPYPDIDFLRGGADGEKHNFHFTVSTKSYFVYKQGSGQYFYFSGDDDVYVFVNGKLLVDLGGAHQQLNGEFNLDNLAKENPELGLENGKAVELKFFYMERHSTASNFYGKMNFKLATDDMGLNFQYDTIPYGYLVDLNYTFLSQRELNTNKNFTFTDDFGNIIGAEGFKLADGVAVKRDDAGNYKMTVTVKDENGNVTKSKEFYFGLESNGTEFTEEEIKAVSDYFRELAVVQGETLEINGLQYDTSTKKYEDYGELQDPNARECYFTMKAEYDAWMEGALVATEGTAGGGSGSIRVLTGSIKVRTDDNANMKSYLRDYGDFTITKYGERDYYIAVSGDLALYPGVQGTESYKNTAAGLGNRDREYTMNGMPIGVYELTIPEDIAGLVGYTITINGKEVTDEDRSLMLQLNPTPEYDAENQTWNWIYPDVEFILKANGLYPLKDLT